MFASASSAAILASTPFVLMAFSATVTLISLRSLSTCAFLNTLVILSTWPFSTRILTSSVPVVTLIAGRIPFSFANAICGGMFNVMQAMLFFVLMTESLNILWSVFSSSWCSASGKRLMLEITASREAFISYLLIRYFASALVFISFLCMSRIIAGSVCIAFHICWFMLSMRLCHRKTYKKVSLLTHLSQKAVKYLISVITYINSTSIGFRILM